MFDFLKPNQGLLKRLAKKKMQNMQDVIKETSGVAEDEKKDLQNAIGTVMGLAMAANGELKEIEGQTASYVLNNTRHIKDMKLNTDAIVVQTGEVVNQALNASLEFAKTNNADLLDALKYIPPLAEITMMIAIEIALADGEICEKESEQLSDLVKRLDLKVEDFPRLEKAIKENARALLSLGTDVNAFAQPELIVDQTSRPAIAAPPVQQAPQVQQIESMLPGPAPTPASSAPTPQKETSPVVIDQPPIKKGWS